MAVAWQRQAFLNDWAGLFVRRQPVDVGPQYAAVAKNIDFYGSAIGKRLGSQIVNGWSALAAAGWTTTAGIVDDASGYRVGDTLNWRNLDGTNGSGTILLVDYGTNTVTLTAPAAVAPTLNAAVWTTRGTLGRVDGLFHAVFRTGTGQERLVAAAADSRVPNVQALWDIWQIPVNAGVSYAPGGLPDAFPLTTVASGTTTQVTLNWIETLVATDMSTASEPSVAEPDIIQILHNDIVIYEGTILHIDNTTGVLTLSAPASQAPVAGDLVLFFPTRTVGDTRFAQGANVTHITSAGGANPVAGSIPANTSFGGVSSRPAVQRTPPVKLAPNGFVYRHGIRAPTSLPAAVPAGVGTNFTYTYRAKFRNSSTEQESEPGPPSLPASSATQDFLVSVNGSTDPQVDKIRLYRNLLGTTGAWYFVGEVDNPGAGVATFHDTIIDAGLGPLMREFLDLTVPNTVSQLVYWPQADRLVGIDAAHQYIVLSDGPDIGIDPVVQTSRGRMHLESFPADNILFVNRDDGDPLVGLAAFYDAILVFKAHSVWRILGTPPDIVIQPVLFRDDRSSVGAFSPKAIAIDQDEMNFAGEDGFYSVSRAEEFANGFQSERMSRQIDDDWAPRLTVAETARIHLIYSRLRRQLRAFAPVDGATEPNDVFVYQYDGTVAGQPHGWAEWTPPAIYVNPSDPSPSLATTASAVVRPHDGLAVSYYGRADGVVVKSDQPKGNDCGLGFPVEYETAWWAPAGPGDVARGRALDASWVVDVFDAASPPVLQLNADFGVAQTVPMPLTGTAGSPFAFRGIIFNLGEFHQVGFKEESPTSMYRLLLFTYHFQALPVTVADRSGFVQTLT